MAVVKPMTFWEQDIVYTAVSAAIYSWKHTNTPAPL